MSSLDRIEFLIDLGMWEFMDEYMVFWDFIEFDLEGEEEEIYKDCIDFY